MPTSTLDDFLEQYRKKLLRGDRRVASALVRSYAAGWKRIKQKLALLQTQYEKAEKAGEPVGLNWYYQRSRLTDMQELIGKELERFAGNAGSLITAEQRKVLAEALEYSREEILLSLGPGYEMPEMLRVKSLNAKAIESAVGINQSGSPLNRLLESISTDGAKRASDALIEGIMLGYSPLKVAPMVRRALGVELNRALTISRTEMMRVQREASHQNYAENAHIVKGWRWQAALTGNTCGVCVSMHGKEFPMTERLTSHPNCRCTAVPISYSWDELGERLGVDWSKVDEAGLSDEEAYAKPGLKMSAEQKKWSADRRLTGEDYFKSLSEAEQRDLLGKTRFNAWKDGAIDFNALTKTTFNLEWGEGRSFTPLRDLLTEEQIKAYKQK